MVLLNGILNIVLYEMLFGCGKSVGFSNLVARKVDPGITFLSSLRVVNCDTMLMGNLAFIPSTSRKLDTGMSCVILDSRGRSKFR